MKRPSKKKKCPKKQIKRVLKDNSAHPFEHTQMTYNPYEVDKMLNWGMLR